MGLRSQIESAERRLNKVLPVVSPPTLKMNIYTEEEWNNKKPIEEDQWALSLIIEEKRPLIDKSSK
jgi:hypothetical protein|tara:strand:- start:39 stop:236 length:198 start_codon:yes stop_codon:yes gene_type:complete